MLVLGRVRVLDVPVVELAVAAPIPYIEKYNLVRWLKLTFFSLLCSVCTYDPTLAIARFLQVLALWPATPQVLHRIVYRAYVTQYG